MNRKFGIIKRQIVKILEKPSASFRGKDVLQIVMSTRKCIYLTKPLGT